MHVRPRLLIASVVLVALSAALTACTGHADHPDGPSRSAGAQPSGSPAPAVGESVAPSASAPSATPTPAPATTSSAAPVKTAAAPLSVPVPVPATRLSLAAAAAGGGLNLVRGGPAKEFTVTVHNGNSQAYRHLLIAFQMEPLTGEPGDLPGPATPFVLEHRDPATGTWRAVDLRMATDVKPAHLYEGGTALAREAVRAERYRLRATATGPTGSSPLMVYAIDADAAEGTPADFAPPGYGSLPFTTRRLL
ncbi:hypothetical protein OG723_35365 [Streptomyces sp. NBC_01278]|uniref:hypothetical protein n=1 Tax=Streptomyces sp. NBC_01278 TaxID=2903809 RepID=UPI002E338ABB|nr:hypothetical protein [Streptomyces sp. NBC_01278]